MSIKYNVDLFRGRVFSTLLKLALPIMAGSFISLAYNLTDMYWVGWIGTSAVAAVGSGGIFIWLSEGVNAISKVGSATYSGQSLGRQDPESAHNYGREGLRLGVALALLFSVIVIGFAGLITSFFAFNEVETVRQTETYLRLIALGFVVSAMSRVSSALFIASGNSKLPFAANATGLCLNILLDPLLIIVFKMGVAGAAIATVTSQLTVALILLFALRRNHLWSGIKVFEPKFDFERVRRIAKLGMPAFLEVACFVTVTIFVTRIVTGFGDSNVAAQRLGVQVESITWMTADGMGAATNAFIAQNFGAKQFERVRKGYSTAVKIQASLGIVATLLLFFLAGDIARVFFSESHVIDNATLYLRIIAFSQIFMGLEIITMPSFAALGVTFLPAMVSITCATLRIPVAYLLSQTALGVNGIWLALTLSSVTAGTTLFVAFTRYKKKIDYIHSF